jgi:hypothetical protein
MDLRRLLTSESGQFPMTSKILKVAISIRPQVGLSCSTTHRNKGYSLQGHKEAARSCELNRIPEILFTIELLEFLRKIITNQE